MILALNKLDLIEEKEKRGEPLEDFQIQENLDAFAQETGFIGAVRCSAKTDTNLAELFSQLVRQMLIKEIADQKVAEE